MPFNIIEITDTLLARKRFYLHKFFSNTMVTHNFTESLTWFFENGDITNKGTIFFELFLSFIISILLWHFTKPSMKISVVQDMAGKNSKYLHVKVSNKGRFLFINRETAYETKGEITFTDMKTNQPSKRYFPKWASKPNPIIPVVLPSNVSISGQPAVHTGYQFDETKIGDSKIEDIYSGSTKLLDIAVKFSGESEFYALTPENFADANFKPADCKITGERYLVNVKITSENGAQCDRKFVLENRDATFEGFLLRNIES